MRKLETPEAPEKHLLGGRTFLALTESTIAQDLHFLSLIKKAKIEEISTREDEDPKEYALRILETIVENGCLLPLLGCLLVPEEAAPAAGDPGETWTEELGRETTAFIGSLKTAGDKAVINSLILSLLIHFFDQGIISSWVSRISSGAMVPESTSEVPNDTEPGLSSSSSSPERIRSEREPSLSGHSEMPSEPSSGA